MLGSGLAPPLSSVSGALNRGLASCVAPETSAHLDCTLIWCILIASCWQGTGWASQIWEVDSHDPSTHTIRWTKGGFQDARASSSGAEWYLE